MKFVKDHLNSHHLFHKPHKWFLALLTSPLHAAEMHYKRKYHLTFRHAKKLFFFDITLLLSIIVLIAGSVFWFNYDPTVVNLVQLQIETTDTRLASGDTHSINVRVENNSSVTLEQAKLVISFPKGFVLENTTEEITNNVLNVGNLAPGEERRYRYEGVLFATPEQEETITATLSYKQVQREAEEVKVTRIVNIVRDSKLSLEVNVPERLIAGSSVPITLTLSNNSNREFPVSVPLLLGNGMNLQNIEVSAGEATNNSWDILALSPQESVQLTATVKADVTADITAIKTMLVPNIRIQDNDIQQKSVPVVFTILHPGLSGSLSFDTSRVSPGEILTGTISIYNTGDSVLKDIRLLLPINNTVINNTRFANENIGRFIGSDFRIDKEHNAGLQSLAPGESRQISVNFPLQSFISGENITLTISPRISAAMDGISTRIEKSFNAEQAVAVGTALTIRAEARYYTNEGDQLGRGPLPPQVGKETKYWAILRVQNSSSRVNNIKLSAILPPGINWTNRSSVSHGEPVNYNPNTKEITWQLANMLPGQQAGINIELALTPTESSIGNHVTLLQDIHITGFDTYIETDLSSTAANVRTDLLNDQIAKQKGTLVR